jgi:hypothetical protein
MLPIWAELIIGCDIGAIGAKKIGEILEKNASLKKLKLDCERPLNPLHDHYPSMTI